MVGPAISGGVPVLAGICTAENVIRQRFWSCKMWDKVCVWKNLDEAETSESIRRLVCLSSAYTVHLRWLPSEEHEKRAFPCLTHFSFYQSDVVSHSPLLEYTWGILWEMLKTPWSERWRGERTVYVVSSEDGINRNWSWCLCLALVDVLRYSINHWYLWICYISVKTSNSSFLSAPGLLLYWLFIRC